MKFNLSKRSNLQQRVITALVALSILIPAVRYSEWAYFAVFFGVCMFTLLEFYKLVGLDGNQPLKAYGTFVGLFIYTMTFLIERHLVHFQYYFLISPIASCIFFIKLYKKNERKPFTNIAFTFLGVIYVAIPFSLLHVFIVREGVYQYQILLGCLFLLWASDTGAYFAGVRYGKTKLFERVSPKKSWEGSIGGALAALVMSFVLALVFEELPAWQWYVIAVIIVVAGTYGDLVESLFKRSIAIKDSGTSLPGHGGFLDRFDGLLLSAPFIATFLNIFS
jgi:phosphatidate cytidylyltransferase